MIPVTKIDAYKLWEKQEDNTEKRDLWTSRMYHEGVNSRKCGLLPQLSELNKPLRFAVMIASREELW